MAKLFYQTTGAAITLLSSLLRLSYSVHGEKNIPQKGPILFTVNHFTRFETFFIPYILYQTTGFQVKTLADEIFFHGLLGRYLNALGAVSRGAANRNKLIIGDLMTDRSKWVIYPEGIMVKNKLTINENGRIFLKSPYYHGLPKTGAAVLSLKAEIIKQLVWENMRAQKTSKVRELLSAYDVKPSELSQRSLNIVPVNITYYPMRPASNISLKIVRALAGKKKLPQRFIEELKVEGSLLEKSKIVVSFSPPFNVGDYVKKSLFLLKKSHFVSHKAMMDYVLQRHRFRLTRKIMKCIYHNLTINYDHLLTFFIFHYKKKSFTLPQIKYFLFCAIVFLFVRPKYFRLSKYMTKDLHLLIAQEKLLPPSHKNNLKLIHDFLSYAQKNNYLSIKKNEDGECFYCINEDKLNNDSSFAKIRIDNPLHVIYNEFRPLFFLLKPLICSLGKGNCERFASMKTTGDVLLLYDRELYRRERNLYAHSANMKNWSVGLPRFLKGGLFNRGMFYLQDFFKKKISFYSPSKIVEKHSLGVVLSHGYKSSPREVFALANYLRSLGCLVYIIRLCGHGTAPVALNDCTKSDWLDDFHRATQAMLSMCQKVVVGGFSAGGVLALQTAADLSQDKRIVGVFSICAPIFLQTKLFKLPRYIVKWNNFCRFFHLHSLRFDFIEDSPENFKTNYSINYLNGVAELDLMIEQIKKDLKKIAHPILVLQGDKDPVVNSLSANYIYDNVKSQKKYLHFFPRSNHVVVNGLGKKEIFTKVSDFIFDLFKNKVAEK